MSGTVQSGIAVTPELSEAWSTALATPTTRLLTVSIESEKLVLGTTADVRGSFEEDFALLDEAAKPNEAQYLLYRLEPESESGWVFYSYVPDTAPVRSKMLYASTRATLLKSLGDARFSESIFATDKRPHPLLLPFPPDPLLLSRPLTEREREMAEIKAAEAKTANLEPAGAGKSMTGASVGLEWRDDAKELIEALAQNGGIARLEIDTKKEEVIAAATQPTGLEFPDSSPSYTFYVHEGSVVFIYACPSSSPIKSRLLYSSSSSGVVSTAKALGITVVKKIETSDPSEVDATYVAEELKDVIGDSTAAAPLPVSEKAAFARPTRPGRKR